MTHFNNFLAFLVKYMAALKWGLLSTQVSMFTEKHCEFPFRYQNKICAGPKCCVLDGGSSWCSTKVDANKFHIRGNYLSCGHTDYHSTGQCVSRKGYNAQN